MRYVKTMNAKSGDILARTIYGLHGHILIKANTVLTPFLIQRLIMLGYPSIYLFDPGESDSALKLALDEHTRFVQNFRYHHTKTYRLKSFLAYIVYGVCKILLRVDAVSA